MKTIENKCYKKAIRLINIAKNDCYTAFPFMDAINYVIWCKKFKRITEKQYNELMSIISDYMDIEK